MIPDTFNDYRYNPSADRAHIRQGNADFRRTVWKAVAPLAVGAAVLGGVGLNELAHKSVNSAKTIQLEDKLSNPALGRDLTRADSGPNKTAKIDQVLTSFDINPANVTVTTIQAGVPNPTIAAEKLGTSGTSTTDVAEIIGAQSGGNNNMQDGETVAVPNSELPAQPAGLSPLDIRK